MSLKAISISGLILFLNIALPNFAVAQITVFEDAPKANFQSLPHGLELLSGHEVITDVIVDPHQPDKFITENSFAVKVPTVSDHKGFGSEQYGEQLKSLGWNNTATTPMFDYFDKSSDDCIEKLVIVSLGPNAQPWLDANDGRVRFEFELLAFSYEKSSSCKESTS